MIGLKDNRNIYMLEIYTLSTVIILYLFRTSFPFLKYPLILLFLALLLYSLFTRRNILGATFLTFSKKYYLALILLFLLGFSFINSDKLYLAVFKDITNAVLLLTLFLIFSLLITTSGNFRDLVESFIRIFIIASLVLSISYVINILGISGYGTELTSIDIVTDSLMGNLSADYNFISLSLLSGFIGSFYLSVRSDSRLKKLIYNLFLVILSAGVLLSGSRRAFLVLVIFLALMIFLEVFQFFRKNLIADRIRATSRYFLLSIAMLIF